MTCWDSGGEDGARLERYACERGESLERVGADMLAAELNRRHVAPVELPATSQPTNAEHRAALDRAKVEILTGMTGREWREGEHLSKP